MKNKHIKTAIRISLLTLAAVIVGLNVYSINASRLAGDAMPMPFGVGAAVVLSGSMEPALSVGDLLIVTEQETYGVGDIVVYCDGATAITHRILSVDEVEVESPEPDAAPITETQITTKGDANNTADEPISPAQIKGEVTLAIPLVGYIVNVIKTPVCTVLILAAAILLLERSFRKEKQQDDERLDELRREIEKLKQQREEP